MIGVSRVLTVNLVALATISAVAPVLELAGRIAGEVAQETTIVPIHATDATRSGGSLRRPLAVPGRPL
jgi:hypothetical protein